MSRVELSGFLPGSGPDLEGKSALPSELEQRLLSNRESAAGREEFYDG